MKTIKIIVLTIAFSLLLSIINLYSVAASHDSLYLILPLLIDPITHFFLYTKWFADNEIIFPLLVFFIFVPIFWPLVIYLLIKIKNRLAPLAILTLIYGFITVVFAYRLIKEEDIFYNLSGSLAGQIEFVGVLLFILGQLGIFYVLRLKKEKRLY